MGRRVAYAVIAQAALVILLVGYLFVEQEAGFGEDGLTVLSFSCGDGVCSSVYGERPETCRRDCAESPPRVSGYYSEITVCPQTAEIFVAHNVDDVVDAVRSLVSRGKRIKARGQGHSAGHNFCSDGGVIVVESMRKLGKMELWRGLDTVVIEPGVTFADLGDFFHKHNRSFGPFATGWGGVSVVGAMATGSHGSDTRATSTTSAMLVEVDIVDQRGQILKFNKFDAEPDVWRALAVHDGALGIVVRARIQAQPQRRLFVYVEEFALVTFKTAEAFTSIIDRCNYAFVNLLVKANIARVTCGAETDEPVTHERLTNFLFAPPAYAFERSLLRLAFQLAAVWRWVEGFIEHRIHDSYQRSGVVGIELEDTDDRIPVSSGKGVGWNHRVVNMPRFPYEVPYFSQVDWALSIRLNDLPAVVQMIDDIFDRYGRTLPTTGIIVRFDRASDVALLAASSVRQGVQLGEPLAVVEFALFAPFGFRKDALDKYMQPVAESVQIILRTFSTARLHLGKSPPEIFEYFAALHRGNDDNLLRFQAVVSRFDPFGVYANQHLRQIGLHWREHDNFTQHYMQAGQWHIVN